MSGYARVFLAIGLMFGSGAVSAADEKVLTSSGGVELAAPSIDHLSCREMQDLLSAYANSGYRGMGVIPMNHPDRPIYDYEHKLAETHYQDCQAGSAYFESTAPVFGQGFK